MPQLTGDEQSDPVEGTKKSGGRRPTIYDIARLTDLSPSTVSRGLSNPGRLNSETEKRIRAAAEVLGYRANAQARALHSGRTGNIGLVVPVISHPVFSGIVRGVENSVMSAGFRAMLAETGGRPDQEVAALGRLSSSVDGFVLVSPRTAEHSLRSAAGFRPLVLVNRDVDGIPSVTPAVDAGYREAVEHLAELGHESIVSMSVEESLWVGVRRREALNRAAAERGMEVRDVEAAGLRLADGAANLAILGSHPADAVFTYNDLMAVGILHAAHSEGIRVPDAFSLVGHDDVFGADFVIPQLSTIRPPTSELGAAAVARLIVEIEGKTAAPVELPTTFVERDSTGPAPR
ncbi:LacI family DNA-binding transcriptional regulator [Brachybacterium saurashtrense]|uniref:LacI family transcriptional regulator n=1 Tax=Brachybacterium saurashtrense TaxID=556288 RepID=A0A345YT17_9MICO|nr:LacI family DNA-binding transcriptional regulator [Brachybacterium saurashtrense]AXK47069.1 LacI family transcriptional regulator [Brachybacterium saurashtrense]RRR20918.1 LacI family transcriptional regulator [Brachybacterium saurashtrense]